MELSKGVDMKLSPQDEDVHPATAAENVNESMCSNIYAIYAFVRRKLAAGCERMTRTTADMIECDGRVGYGLAEHLDQIVDGKPVGIAS